MSLEHKNPHQTILPVGLPPSPELLKIDLSGVTADPARKPIDHIQQYEQAHSGLEVYAQLLGRFAIDQGAGPVRTSYYDHGDSHDYGTSIDSSVAPLRVSDSPARDPSIPFNIETASDKLDERRESSPEAQAALARFLGDVAVPRKEEVIFAPYRKKVVEDHKVFMDTDLAYTFPTSTFLSGNAQDMPMFQGNRVLPAGYDGTLPDDVLHPAAGQTVTPKKQWSSPKPPRDRAPIDKPRIDRAALLVDKTLATLSGDVIIKRGNPSQPEADTPITKKKFRKLRPRNRRPSIDDIPPETPPG